MIKLSQNIIDMLHSSRKISFRYDLLNFDEIKIGELTGLGGKLGLSSLAQIKRKGTFRFKENESQDVDWLNNRVRPVLILNNEYEFPLGVFMISSPARESREIIGREVQGYDTSLILHEDKFDNRFRVIKNTNYVTAITQIINSAGISKVNIPFIDARIKTDREFEIGTSKLEAVNYLLREINYTSVWVDQIGNITATPYILPSNRDIEYSYKNDEISVIVPDTVIEEIDLFDVANKWVVVASNPDSEPLVARYTNDNAGSATSITNRRRTIVDLREVDGIANQAILEDYTRRIAYEASSTYNKFIFETTLMPHHSYMDSLFCEHTGLNIKSKYIETSWEMELKPNGKMKHSCRRVVQI